LLKNDHRIHDTFIGRSPDDYKIVSSWRGKKRKRKPVFDVLPKELRTGVYVFVLRPWPNKTDFASSVMVVAVLTVFAIVYARCTAARP
jgi:hypothetical protein